MKRNLFLATMSIILFFSCSNEQNDSYYIEKFNKSWQSYIATLADSSNYKTGLPELSTVVDTFTLNNQILLFENYQNEVLLPDSLFEKQLYNRSDTLDELLLGLQGGPFDQTFYDKPIPENYYDVLLRQKVISNLYLNDITDKKEINAYISFLKKNTKIYFFSNYSLATGFKTSLAHVKFQNFTNESAAFLINTKDNRLISIVQVGLNITINGTNIHTWTRTNGYSFITAIEYISLKNEDSNKGFLECASKNKVLYSQFYFDEKGYARFLCLK